mgnify:CR=1 FL=1
MTISPDYGTEPEVTKTPSDPPYCVIPPVTPSSMSLCSTLTFLLFVVLSFGAVVVAYYLGVMGGRRQGKRLPRPGFRRTIRLGRPVRNR